jgi:hypothetical protein
MKGALSRALLLVAWSVPTAAAFAVAIQALSAWLGSSHVKLAFIAFVFVAGVLPYLLLAYIATGKRFGVGWHWFASTVASLLAVEIGRLALSKIEFGKQLASAIRSSCSMPSEAPFDQLQHMAVSCGITSWLSITSGTYIRTLAGGLVLVVAAWGYKRFVRRAHSANE